MAKPNVADIDGKAALGRDLAERVHIVDEGGEEHESQSWLQQTNFYCEETCQHNGNLENDIPKAHGLPLKGEWTVLCASGDTGWEVEQVDTLNKPTELLTMTVEPYVDDSDWNACVCLRGMQMRTDDANGPGNRVDASSCQADGSSCKTDVSSNWADASRGQTDTLEVLNNAEIDHMSHGKGLSMFLSIGDTKHVVLETDSDGSHADASTGQMDASSIKTDARIPANMPENVRTSQKRAKPSDLPVEGTICNPDELNASGNQTDMSSGRTDGHSIRNDEETAVNASRNVSMRQTRQRTQYSPVGREIETPKPAIQWRRISVEGVDVYIPQNAPVEALGQTFEFGQVEGRDKAIAPSVEGERACDGDGD